MSTQHGRISDEVYGVLPSVTCAHCGHCCSLWAGMRYVEYGNVRQYIHDHWAATEVAVLQERIRRHYRIRSVYIDAPSELPRLLPSAHCLLYDEAARRCRVYPARPLDCRLYGLNGECDKVVFLHDQANPAATSIATTDCTQVLERISTINEQYTDPKTGRTIGCDEAKPIEFWFALFEVGWDPTLDQNDAQFIASRMNQPEKPSSPSDC